VFFAIFDTVRIFCELVFTLKVLCLFANLLWLYCTDLVSRTRTVIGGILSPLPHDNRFSRPSLVQQLVILSLKS